LDRGGALSRAARLAAALVAGALVAGTASAVVWRADAPKLAEFELVAKLDAVGRIEKGGVATLIATDWAITAAHVAERLVPGDRIVWKDKAYAIGRVVIHPQGHPDPARPRTPPEVDLALVQLAEPVPATVATGVMPNRATDEAGKMLVIAGYGDFGPSGSPLAREDGKLRAVENEVADAGPLRLFLPFDAPPAGLPLEGIGGPGDSGGPAISFGPFFGMKLMGVSSGADGPPGQYGTVDVYTRVSSHIAWIEEVAGAFSEIEPVKRVEPDWPRKALIKGTNGVVIIEATIGVDGAPSEVRIVASRPEGVFDASVKNAFSRWRFAPRVEAGVKVVRTLRQRFDFEVERH
jgi:TonB family protein